MSDSSRGFTLVELLVVVAIVGVLTALAVPMLMRARMSANESAAIGAVRSINSGEAGYAAAAAHGGYATQLSVLAASCPGGKVGFISPDLSNDPSNKSGYTVTLGPGAAAGGPADCNGTPSWLGYYLKAEPIGSGTTGHRAFASTSRAVIYFDINGLAPTEAAIDGGAAAALQ